MSLSVEEAKIPEELNQQAINWLLRLRSDDLSDAEMNAFADWLVSDPLHGNAFAKAEDLFSDMVLAAHGMDMNVETLVTSTRTSLNHTEQQPKSVLRRPRHGLPISLALAAAWLLATSLIMPQSGHLIDDYLSDYHTDTGEIKDIELSDGSHLLLNTNSAVSIAFNNTSRQITLHHGQVRFTVAKDNQRPFEVVSGDLVVRALGTVFDVYQLNPTETNVTVQEHTVAVRLRTTHQFAQTSVNVQQGQRLQYRLSAGLSQPQPLDLDAGLAWQQHRLFINDRPLSELISELQRYRAGHIFLADAELSNLRVTGVFSLDNPDEAISSVRKALGLQETHLGPWWVLLHR